MGFTAWPALAADVPHRVNFPPEILKSQSGAYTAGFETLRLPGRDSGTYRLVVRKAYQDRDLARYDFYRSAAAQWSEYSDSLFVTDFAGSNQD